MHVQGNRAEAQKWLRRAAEEELVPPVDAVEMFARGCINTQIKKDQEGIRSLKYFINMSHGSLDSSGLRFFERLHFIVTPNT